MHSSRREEEEEEERGLLNDLKRHGRLSVSLSPMLSSHVNVLGLIADTLTLHIVLLCHIHCHNSAIRSVRRLQGHDLGIFLAHEFHEFLIHAQDRNLVNLIL